MLLPITANFKCSNLSFGRAILDARSRELFANSASFRRAIENLERTSTGDVFVTRSASRHIGWGEHCSDIVATDMESGEAKTLGQSHDYSECADIGGPYFTKD